MPVPEQEQSVSVPAPDDGPPPKIIQVTTTVTPSTPSADREDPSGGGLPQNDEPATETNHEKEKKPEEGIVPVAGATAAQDDKKEEKPWNSSAALYCPVRGQPHSDLLQFSITQCPSCHQNLARAGPWPGLPSFGSQGHGSWDGFWGGSWGKANEGEGEEEEEEEKKKKEEEEEGDGNANDKPEGAKPTPISEQLKVTYTIEYRDLGNNHIASEDWGRPFQLERARMAALNKDKGPAENNKETVFEVVTVLQTSIQPNRARPHWETKHTRRSDIIGNSQISVAVQYTKLIISSRLFIDALKSVVPGPYVTQDTLKSDRLELNEPFPLIGHHLEELETYVQRTGDRGDETEPVDRETRTHVGFILDIVKPILKDAIAQELARHGGPVPTCTYRMLWYLFRPGDTVYVSSDEGEDAYMVDSVEMDKFHLSSMDVNVVCRIKMWHLDFNGECITQARRETTVKPFKGEREITSLDVVPCKIWDKMDGGELRKVLEERGKKWVSHLQGKQVEYRGEPFEAGKSTVRGLLLPPMSFTSPTACA